MKKLLLSAFTISTLSLAVNAHEDCEIHKANALFDRKTKLNIPTNYDPSLVTKDVKNQTIYNDINQKVYLLYSNQVKKLGATLKINDLWSSKETNAFAMKIDKAWTVNMHGGLYRHPYLTNDAHALVVCHEIGHLIGGAPYNSATEKTSVEGQADLWAIASCFPRYLMAFGSEPDYSDKKVESLCKSQNVDLRICYQSTKAAESLSKTLAQLTNQPIPSLAKQSANIATSTMISHPPAQCRLDTFMNGILCDVKDDLDYLATINNSTIDKVALRCDSPISNNKTARPSCWFNSNTHNVSITAEKYKNSTGKLTVKYIGFFSGNYKVMVYSKANRVQFFGKSTIEENHLFPNTAVTNIFTFKIPNSSSKETLEVKIFNEDKQIYSEVVML